MSICDITSGSVYLTLRLVTAYPFVDVNANSCTGHVISVLVSSGDL